MLSHKKPDSVINEKVEFGEGEGKVPLDNIAKRAEAYKPKERVTYKMIKEYIEAKYGFKVHTALQNDGYELYPADKMSNRDVYMGGECFRERKVHCLFHILKEMLRI